MATIQYLSEADHDPRSVVTVGTFDGVHEGHKSIINRVVDRARANNARSVVVTFDPHPREVINAGKNPVKLLTTPVERAEILRDLNVDVMVVIPFDRDFSLLSSGQFIRDIIFKKIGIMHLVIGYDHQFGKNREGTIGTARELAGELGFNVEVVEAHEVGEVTVSSTTVRVALEKEGDVEMAARFLGRPYSISGIVQEGDRRGRIIGYPTANIRPDNERKIVPLNGVYAVRVYIGGEAFGGMMNIGFRPTFRGDRVRVIEVNIFDFSRDIYGKSVRIDFIKRIRDEKKFDSATALAEQLAKDKADCLNALI
ncbi:MAG: bifunctional riboflavin kinase/FAD synthetase [Balneolaceae bacterium]|nr:MAG: bifunctional riboflavin kinase/FAD synthetase [Balneolaceae bacterium]